MSAHQRFEFVVGLLKRLINHLAIGGETVEALKIPLKQNKLFVTPGTASLATESSTSTSGNHHSMAIYPRARP